MRPLGLSLFLWQRSCAFKKVYNWDYSLTVPIFPIAVSVFFEMSQLDGSIGCCCHTRPQLCIERAFSVLLFWGRGSILLPRWKATGSPWLLSPLPSTFWWSLFCLCQVKRFRKRDNIILESCHSNLQTFLEALLRFYNSSIKQATTVKSIRDAGGAVS